MKSPGHILIIDDDPLLRRLFGGKLGAEGFDVIYARDGQEGREVARRLQPDLILLDIRMPGMDGYQTAAHLKSEKETSHIRVVFLTNEDFSVEAEKMSKEFMIDGYIHKSVDLDEFVKKVKTFLKPDKRNFDQ